MAHDFPELVRHLEKLPHFVAVAEAGSLRGAGRKLGLSQPSLTKSIRALEATCGAELFARRPQGLALTEVGKVLLEISRSILRSAREFEARTQAAGEEPRLRFVTHELLLPELTPALRSEKLSLNLYTHPSVSHLLGRIHSYEADAGVLALMEPVSSLDMYRLSGDHYEFYAAPGFLEHAGITRKDLSDPGILSSLPMVLAPGVLAGGRETLGDHLARRGLELNVVHTVAMIESVATLVGLGFGIGLLPTRFAARSREPKLERLNLRGPGLKEIGKHEFVFCCRRGELRRNRLLRSIYQSLKKSLGRSS